MNKRGFKKKHPDWYSRWIFKHYIEWCNLYKRELRRDRKGKYKNRVYFHGINIYYIKQYKEKYGY